MKWFIASDIHGSSFYCKKMLEAYDREQADRLLLLGDLLYHGPRNDLPEGYAPKEVIALLNERKDQLLCVRGNCEAEVDQMVLQFPVLADYCILDLGNRLAYLTHGHHASVDNPPALQPRDLFLQGHTHVPYFEKREGVFYMNPGSVSLPKENSWHGYLILENDCAIYKDLEGTVMRTEKL